MPSPVSTVSKPVKELKHFQKVFLEPGQSARVVFDVTAEDLAYYNIMLQDYIVESGRYAFYLASSSRDIRAILSVQAENPECYTMQKTQEDRIG